VQEKTVEFAWAIAKEKKGKIGAINFLMDISPDCDCLGRSDASIVPEIGMLASDDVVAIDRASIDLINRQPSLCNTIIPGDRLGEADKFAIIHGVDWMPQFAYAEEIGLGSASYELQNL
jgi:uncharacterized Fe-S center protein